MSQEIKPSDLLDMLHDEGVSAMGTYNDDIEQSGWFGWTVFEGLLHLTFDRGIDRAKFEAHFRLEPVNEDGES